MSRCICDISTNIKPKPMAAKNTKKGKSSLQCVFLRRQNERHDDKEGCQAHNSSQQSAQYKHGPHMKLVHCLFLQVSIERIPKAQHVKEERAVINRRCDIGREVRGEASSGPCRQQWQRNVESEENRGLRTTSKRSGRCRRFKQVEILSRKRLSAHKQRANTPNGIVHVPDNNNVAPGIRDAQTGQ